MTVVLHEAAIRRFFHSEEGPLGRYISHKSQEIVTHMHNGLASHVRSSDLIQSLRETGIFQDPDALYSVIVADAAHPWKGHADFEYGIALEEGGMTPSGQSYGPFPWMAPALVSAGFRRGA